MTAKEVTDVIRLVRTAATRDGADVTVGRAGTGKHKTLTIWGAQADAVAKLLEARGLSRTGGTGTRLDPITMDTTNSYWRH